MMTDELQVPAEEHDVPQAPEPAPTVSTEGWWKRWMPGRKAKIVRLEARLVELDEVIALHPEAAVNYALRGECYLELAQPELALIDFERALAIALPQIERDAWGLVAQTVTDRALRGAQCARRQISPDVDKAVEHYQPETEPINTGAA